MFFYEHTNVATTPTACGIETIYYLKGGHIMNSVVATTPTACGIETLLN